MKHTIGSVLQFTPAPPGGEVTITFPKDKTPLDYPLIGWAIVVVWSGEPDTTDQGEQETRLEPVTLMLGYPTTMHSLQLDDPGTIYEVRP